MSELPRICFHNMAKKKCLIPHEEQNFERCLFCNVKINLSFQEKLDKAVAEVPQETKQKILDLLHEGKSIGYVKEAVNLSTLIVGEIVVNNITAVNFLRKEAI